MKRVKSLTRRVCSARWRSETAEAEACYGLQYYSKAWVISCALQEWIHAAHSKRQPSHSTWGCDKRATAAIEGESTSGSRALISPSTVSGHRCSSWTQSTNDRFYTLTPLCSPNIWRKQDLARDNLLGSSDLSCHSSSASVHVLYIESGGENCLKLPEKWPCI